jgi:hypothetical protein
MTFAQNVEESIFLFFRQLDNLLFATSIDVATYQGRNFGITAGGGGVLVSLFCRTKRA